MCIRRLWWRHISKLDTHASSPWRAARCKINFVWLYDA